MAHVNDDKLLTPEQASALIGVKVGTLAVWRCTKRYALPYIKVGRLVRYRREDVDAFIQASRQVPQTA